MQKKHKWVIKGWGWERWIENNDLYCCKHLHVLPTKWCSVHYHKLKKETFYVINGELLLRFHDSTSRDWWQNNFYKVHEVVLRSGESFTLETGVAHAFTSNTSQPCDFIESSTHHDDEDSYRIIKGD